LLDPEFEAKIVDFGVAKKIIYCQPLHSKGDGLTISSFMGSHGYTTPGEALYVQNPKNSIQLNYVCFSTRSETKKDW